MSIKTILVHLADDRAHVKRLEVGFELAHRFGAHLTALFVTTPVSMPAAVTGRGASHAYIAQASELSREKAARVEIEFRERCRRQGLAGEWRCESGDHLELLELHSRYADLAIVSPGKSTSLEDQIALVMPEQLPLTASCPVLIVPAAWTGKTIGTRALISWKSTRESARTVHGAVPLLAKAEAVRVVSIGENKSDHLPGAEISTYLARHGIKVETATIPGGDERVGPAILADAEEQGSDLIVMGAYGHHRLRELVFGGTTRHVIYHARLPLLMMH
jgi:nucleotide-binding universal stress UspA family protein